MAKFYEKIDGAAHPLVSPYLVGVLYQSLSEALQGQDDPAVRRRIYDLVEYVHYVDLYQAYRAGRGAERQAAFAEMLDFVLRQRGSDMVHSWGLYRSQVERGRDKQVVTPPQFDLPEGESARADASILKPKPPLTEQEILAVLEQGLKDRPHLGFEPKSFPENYVPWPKDAPPAPSAEPGDPFRTVGETALLVYFQPEQTLEFTVTGGFRPNRGPVKLTLYAAEKSPPRRTRGRAGSAGGSERA